MTQFITRDGPPPQPKLDRKRASYVIARIDEILESEKRSEKRREIHFVELGRHLCEVRAGQYWRLERLHSFDEFLTKRFPGSRRKAYYFMSIHEHLPKSVRKHAEDIGWSKAAELVKVARSDGRHFDYATWLHKASSLPKEEFKHEVEKHLTGKDTEPYEIVYFKLYKSQLPVVEQALETAALMLGSDRSRGYCLEMICADFLAGAAAPDSIAGVIPETRAVSADGNQGEVLDARLEALARDGWRCQQCGKIGNSEVHHQVLRSHSGAHGPENLITLCAECHKSVHERTAD
ncbi:MAG TPA: HNH endonuclease [bacterium]|nr:HNH endonuclease [bacterium]